LSRRIATVLVGALAAFAAIAEASCDGTFEFDAHSVDAGGVPDVGQGDAADASPAEDASGRPCASDAQCRGTRCETATGTCVACLGNDDCKETSRRFCAPQSYCVECLTNDTCGARKRCDTSAHRCVDTCEEGDEDCPSGLSCNEDRRLCVECRNNANCSGHPGGSFCDTSIGRCVECASSAQCSTEKPTCDRRNGRCVECIGSAACGAGRICEPSTLTCIDP